MKRNFEKTKKYYTRGTRFVSLCNVWIKIKLDPDDYDHAFKQTVLKEKQIVPPEDAERWLNTNLICNPTKYDLDMQREKECSVMDVMQTTNMLYHMDSVVEVQIIANLIVQMYAKFFLKVNLEGSDYIFYMLLLEHSYSYFAD